MALSLLHEIAIRFIRRDQNHARLALLVSECVPILQRQLRDGVIRRVRHGLEEFSRRSPDWALEVREGGRPKRLERMLLHRTDQRSWSSKENHGVWFRWAEHDGHGWPKPAGAWVGVEWPLVAESFVAKSDFVQLFPDEPTAKEVGQRREHKEWFARPPCGNEWIGWANLVAKSETEMTQFADRTVEFMRRVAREIDEAEARHRDAGGRQ